MRISSFVSFFGFVLLIAGVFSPVLRPFHLFNLDVYQLSKPVAIILLVISVAGLLGTIMQQRGITRATAFASLLLVVVLYLAVVLKVNSAFSVIPFKGLSNALARGVAYKWGWLLLFIGSVMAVVGSIANKRPAITPVV